MEDYSNGYPRVAAFENCDPNFLIYRKFGWLHNRALLYLQDELVELESKLESQDNWICREDDPTKLQSRRDGDGTRKRPSVLKSRMKEIREKLQEYGPLKTM